MDGMEVRWTVKANWSRSATKEI